ncbi:hypothetical protein JXR74_08185 [Candidatus Mcinerneyibacteriota bacterium]|nr:hypothetical protein [Candidatus Mcinerneyibacteriota bacterium]
MRTSQFLILGLFLISGCRPVEEALQNDFTTISLRLLFSGTWRTPARLLHLASLNGKVYGLDKTDGRLFVTYINGKKIQTETLSTLPVGCEPGEIFNPAAFIPLSSRSFLIADRYRNRLHLISEKGKNRETLFLSSRGIYPSGNRIMARKDEHRGALLFIDSSSRGEILLIRTQPFGVESFTGEKQSLRSSCKKKPSFSLFSGDLIYTTQGFFRLTYSPSLYRVGSSGVFYHNEPFTALRDVGYSFSLNPKGRFSGTSFLKAFLCRVEMVALRDEVLLLFYDDHRQRILALSPDTRVKAVIPWPKEIPWKKPHLIPAGERQFLLYGDDKRFFLFETETALFR